MWKRSGKSLEQTHFNSLLNKSRFSKGKALNNALWKGIYGEQSEIHI
jgi:hypothetical protein